VGSDQLVDLRVAGQKPIADYHRTDTISDQPMHPEQTPDQSR
jgi:hypothetical protein